MINETPFRITQLSAFNPGRLTDDEIERVFVARIKVFEHLFKQIISEQPNSIPQHHIIVGERGMGKSTLLHRLAVELRKTPHNALFIPLTFPEEQYNIDRLSKFWLNCLDALADALDRIEHPEMAALDTDIDVWNKTARQIDAMQMYGHFETWCHKIGRRPVLLVDNLGLIFDKISIEEQHQLRAILMKNNAPLLVGASAHTLGDTVDYGKPFYDYFKPCTLQKLSFEESLETLKNLGKLTNNQAFINEIYAKQPRMRALYQLTGGTPRTLTMLFPLIQNGLSVSIQTDLEALMDTATSLYKARFEELPAQMQVVLDAVAMNWNPVTIETLRELTQLDNAQISSQLTRLYNVGWLNRMDAYKAKGNAYEIGERFFNIWYLMRRSSRRQKRELLCLSKFLATLYGDELPNVAKDMLHKGVQHTDHASIHLAMADAVQNKRLSKQLRDNSYKALVDWGVNDVSIFSDFDIPKEFIDKKEAEIFENARKYYDNKQFEEAAEQLELLVKLNKKRKDVWSLLGHLYQTYLSCYAESEQAYQKAIDLDEKDAVTWNSLGNLYQVHLHCYSESEQAYLKAIDLDKKDAATWYCLGNLYQSHLNRYDEAEQAYRKAIDLDKKFAYPWNNLGNLYQYNLNRYVESEKAYQKSIELDKKFAYPWNNLGNLYQRHLRRYADAEQAYHKAIELDEKGAGAWNGLGNLYKNHLNRYAESEQAYQKAIELDEKYASAWNGLGNLYLDCFKNYPQAEEAYQKALVLGGIDGMVKHNLIFLYRDKMNRASVAKTLFDSLQSNDDFVDTYYLHATLFAFYDKNLGIAAENLEKALFHTGGALSPETQDDWWRFASIAHRLGHGGAVLQVLETTGYEVQLRPYYVATKALGEKDSSAYLMSIAAEVREPAAMILKKIETF
jgi:tetratricopeptide (TPR) repeat protein